MAKSLRKSTGHRLKSLSVIVNDNNELVLTGKGRRNQDYSQTLPVSPPCVLFWNDATDNFMAFAINGEIDDNFEFVDVILKVE